MQHIVSLSGGASSAIAAERVIQRYGKDAVTLWFADTSWEDEDLYRFLSDCCARWGIEPVIHREGRTPLQVAEDEHIIPNQKLAPCTHRLKTEPFARYIKTLSPPITIHLGLDWTEQHRMAAPKRRYEEIPGVTVDFPLMWEPIENRRYHDIIQQDWRIQIPRLYTMGFPHNNCGGRCVRQGISEWMRLKRFFPERFTEVRDWEAAQRAKGGALANYAICRDQSGGQVRPRTLAEIEQTATDRGPTGRDALIQEDLFACFCSY
jgi:hypothetical protein